MEKETRNAIERATQRARTVLEEDYAAELEGDFDVHRSGAVAAKAGKHLSPRQVFHREKVIAAIEHKRAAGMDAKDAVADYLRDAAFTTLNRFVALKMLEARDLVQECVTKGEQSSGYQEFCGMAPGVQLLPNGAGYRLYVESIFDELSTEVKVLFDRRDPSSVLWPRRATFEQLLEILNSTELARVWAEDETIGWVYQFFNGQDERRKMREESQAPRNSRELAVRNQFFTPRYVVQFLTDNTLGRIWYEMRGTKTGLADTCEYMVRKPGEEFAARMKKDPRDIRVLDPACGSGHFLLYAFDLLLKIYEEAYADPESPKSEATGKTLSEDYPTLDALRNALPGLVLAHNLYGVDIDARCAQIAQLALWMRAQKTYRDFGIVRTERTQIRRSNIVVAEPLVADEQMAKEFVAKLGDEELRRVFTSLVDSLNLAGDLGLLLRVERLVARAPAQLKTADLFAPADGRIRGVLSRFVSDAAGDATPRRRLFVDDTAQGLGLLAIAERRFDVALMNPPFGLTTSGAYAYIRNEYPGAHNDVFATFVARAKELAPTGLIGAITSRGFLVAPRMDEFRLRHFLPSARLLADFGLGVMDDAFVESCAYVLEPARDLAHGRFQAFDLRDHVERAMPVSAWPEPYHPDRVLLAGLPKARVLYALPDDVSALLKSARTRFEPAIGTAREGMKTFDNSRFLRLRWEVEPRTIAFGKDSSWTLLAKGGAFAHYLGVTNVVVNWRDDGRELQEINLKKNGSTAQVRQASTYWGRAGVTFSGRSARGFSARALPSGHIISGRGPAILPLSNVRNEVLLGWVNARLIRAFIHLQASASYFATGIVKQLPWVTLRPNETEALVASTSAAIKTLIAASSVREPSPYFIGPIIEKDAASALMHSRALAQRAESSLEETMGKWDAAVDAAYKIDSSSWGTDLLSGGNGTEDDADEDVEDGGHETGQLTEKEFADAVLSFAVGAVFGRWDPEATRRRAALLDGVSAFDALPVFALAAGDTDKCRCRSEFVDDEGGQADLVAAVEKLLEQTSGAPTFASELVAWTGAASLRSFFRADWCSGFFQAHLATYSKSRRKAPIYWQLATPSASYSVWLYIHAFTKDTLFRVQNDYVAPKLAHEERRLESLADELRNGTTASQRKQFAAQEALVQDLRALLDEVKRVAPIWNPNLDDGVIINFAPLWRLVPQNKPWQKELKSTWDELCAGEYDWAHLAMHLWPERVVPKCAKDRSLAIAHGLEDVFWVEGSDGKLTARKTPTRKVDELVHERTSPAVKAALKSLLEAPAATGGSGRGRGARKRDASIAEEEER